MGEAITHELIMDLVFRGNADGSFLDIDQLMEASRHAATILI
jgi:hypothetical protein